MEENPKSEEPKKVEYLRPEDFKHTKEQLEAMKKDLYERLNVRRRKFIDRIGYAKWDPFQVPFDPIDIRKDETGRTAKELNALFMQSLGDNPSPDYEQAVAEFNVMLVMNKEKIRPVFDYCLWYAEHLKRNGIEL